MTATSDPLVDDFVGFVRKCGLLEPAAIDGYLAKHGPAESARQLAGHMIRDGVLTNFQARMLLEGKHKGFIANGKYRVLELIAVGGMGSVYLCEHMFMKRLVALKVLTRDQPQAAGAAERFLREARAAAALDHPNLIRAFDVDKLGTGANHCLIMEFAEGVNLQTFVEKAGPLSPAKAANYVAQAAAGLAAAHAAGLIHRDVKPANLLLTRQATVKVLDLGLARFSGGKADNLTRELASDVILGTIDYIAPEQATNDAGVDGRVDVYSLGCTLYFLLTGQPPYPTGSTAQKLIYHQSAKPTPVGSVINGVPNGLIDVVHKMLAKAPGDRYPDMRAVVDALAPFAGGSAVPPDDRFLPQYCPAVRKLIGDAAPVAASGVSTHEFLIPPVAMADASGVRSGGGRGTGTLDLTEVPMWRGRPVNAQTAPNPRVALSAVRPQAGGTGAVAPGPRGGLGTMIGVAVTAAVLGIAAFAAFQSNKPPEVPAAVK